MRPGRDSRERRSRFLSHPMILILLHVSLCTAAPAEEWNVLLVTLDTTRRDALGFHGAAPSPTPHLDALAAESLVFEDAYSVAPLTLPAHASILTGLYPARHGVRSNAIFRLPGEARTLTEVLAERGYATSAAVASYVLDAGFGLDQGFQSYDAPSHRDASRLYQVADRPADEMVDLAIERIGALSEPFFSWLHCFDPHYPYRDHGKVPAAELPADPRARDRVRYRGEIAFLDAQLGRLFAFLDAAEFERPLLLVVTSDHGESLFDGVEPTHGNFVYDPTMRVPLLLRVPGMKGRRIAGTASLIDVAPTVLGLLGLGDSLAAADGVDHASLLRSDATELPPRTIALESYYLWLSHGWAPYEGIVDGSFKYLHSRRDELYDRSTDPAEAVDLLARNDPAPVPPELAAELERVFAAPATLTPQGLSDEERRQLELLGYVEGSAEARTGRPPFETLPDAFEKLPLLETLEEVSRARILGQRDRMLRLLRVLCREAPESPTFQQQLGMELMRQEPPPLEEALFHLEAAIELQERHAVTQFYLGRCRLLLAQDHYQRVRAAVAAGQQIPPDSIRREQELRKAALRAFQRSVELEPARAESRLHVAAVEELLAERAAQAGRGRVARSRYEAALEELDWILRECTDDAELTRQSSQRRERIRAALDALD
jgi:arylsulfatase A-like enzyme